MADVSPELLAGCLADVQAGSKTAEECVAEHPALAAELRDLLRLARAAAAAPDVAPDPSWRAGARAALLSAIAAEGAPRRPERPAGLLGRLRLRLPLPALGALVAALMLALLGGGAAYGSRGALPGDVLYPVKTSIEQWQLTVARSDAARARTYADIAGHRANEVQRAASAGRGAAARDAANSYVDDVGRARLYLQQATAGTAISGDARAAQLHVASALVQQQETLHQAQSTAPEPARAAIAQAVAAAEQPLPVPAQAPPPAATPGSVQSTGTVPAPGGAVTPTSVTTPASSVSPRPSTTPVTATPRATATPTRTPTRTPTGTPARSPTPTPAALQPGGRLDLLVAAGTPAFVDVEHSPRTVSPQPDGTGDEHAAVNGR